MLRDYHLCRVHLPQQHDRNFYLHLITLLSEDRNFYHVVRADELGINLLAARVLGKVLIRN